MPKEKKVSVNGILVLKELSGFIKELSHSPDIRRINPGETYTRGGGNYKGVKMGHYDPTFHRLKISCYTHQGTQEFYLVTSPKAVEGVKKYIEGLSNKYF